MCRLCITSYGRPEESEGRSIKIAAEFHMINPSLLLSYTLKRILVLSTLIVSFLKGIIESGIKSPTVIGLVMQDSCFLLTEWVMWKGPFIRSEMNFEVNNYQFSPNLDTHLTTCP